MLREALHVCLTVGNVLNRGPTRGNACGFDLAILPTLGSVKEASQRRSDAPAPQVGARKASAVSNVL